MPTWTTLPESLNSGGSKVICINARLRFIQNIQNMKLFSHLTGLGHVSYNKAADQRANTTDKPALAIAIITMSEKSSGRLF